ncbi:MAG: AAA family ATPase [Candidatus Marinimicrobia bacterium]|nr:AAA family ATPase [Candidatus Neomarinimicrobiota bacterium]
MMETTTQKSTRWEMKELIKRDHFTGSQVDALVQLESFIKDETAKCFILKGYAGTGKTHLIHHLVEYLKEKSIPSKVLAPTGRAVRILAEKHNLPAATIHKSIYYMKDLKEYCETGKDGKITYKYYYNLLPNEQSWGTVYLIDEASMVSDFYNEQEFVRFGSGHLLTDLMNSISLDVPGNPSKVIFVGDNAQLPPVGMNFSPALSESYFRKKFGIVPQSAELTDVVRQKQDSLVLKNATNIREILDRNVFNNFSFEYDNHTVFDLDPDEILSKFISGCKPFSKSNPIIITYSNALAKSYNLSIREKLFPGKPEITTGDRIIAVKNNYNFPIDIMNGQIGYIGDIKSSSITRYVPLNTGKNKNGEVERISVKLIFREVRLLLEDDQQKEHVVSAMILENILYNDLAALHPDESRALYVDFIQRNPHLKRGSEEFKRALRNDHYFNALQIKFAYAITCHKAQGGEWPEVFVDFDGCHSLTRENLRWSYTAITRASDQLYLCNPIVQNLLHPAKMSHEDLYTIDEDDIMAPHSDHAIAGSIPDILIEAPIKSQNIYKLLAPLLPDTLVLQDFTSRPYQELYRVKFGNETFKIIAFYNQHNRLSKVQFNRNIADFPVTTEEITQKLQNISIDEKEEVKENLQNTIPMDCNHQFFRQISALYSKNKIAFDVKKQSDFHYAVTLSHMMETGEFDYYFDKNYRFTKFTPRGKTIHKQLFNRVLAIHLESGGE